MTSTHPRCPRRTVRTLRASAAEWRLIEAAASEAQRPTTTWLRDVALREARRVLRVATDGE